MIDLKVEITFFNKQKHTIHLGNQEWLSFKSKKYLRDYLVRYKRTLKTNVFILNNFHLQIYQIFRLHYFQFNRKFTNQFEELNSNFTYHFDKIFKKYSDGNHNAFMLGHISMCIKHQNDLIELIMDFAKKQKNYTILNLLKPLEKQLYDFEIQYEKDLHDLKMYPKSKSNNLKIIKTA